MHLATFTKMLEVNNSTWPESGQLASLAAEVVSDLIKRLLGTLGDGTDCRAIRRSVCEKTSKLSDLLILRLKYFYLVVS